METLSGWILMAGVVLLHTRAAHGQNVLRGASSCPPVPVTCDPASVLLIRTAEYRKPTTPASANPQCTVGTCTGSDCKMSSGDVIRVYRKCNENVTHCDLPSAGVAKDFRIDYYCLKNENLKDPCNARDSQWPGTSSGAASDTILTFYVNYARYSSSRDFTCQCLVTSANDTTTISATNLYENLHSSGRVPNVMIDTGRYKWPVGERAIPAQWGIQNSTANLTFDNINGASFGHLWLEFRGPSLRIVCNSTLEGGADFVTSSPSGAPSASDSAMSPTSSAGTQSASGPSLLVIIAAAAASGAFVILVVVIIVVTIKCRRMSARNKEMADIKLPAHELNTVTRPGSSYNRDGDYTAIRDLKPPPVVGVVRSRDGRKSFSDNYEPRSRDYEPTSRDYEPTSRDYEPTSRDNKPSSRDYKSAPRDHKRTSPEYEPTSREYEPTSRGRKPSTHDYRPMPMPMPRGVQLHSAYDATVQALKKGQMAARAKSQKKPEISTISRGGDGLPGDASAHPGRWDDHGAYASSSVTPSHGHGHYASSSVTSSHGHGHYASSSVTSSDYGSLYRQPGQMSPTSSDTVIYDRAGYFRPGDGPKEDIYNKLRYERPKEKIIDNVYDNSTFV